MNHYNKAKEMWVEIGKLFFDAIQNKEKTGHDRVGIELIEKALEEAETFREVRESELQKRIEWLEKTQEKALRENELLRKKCDEFESYIARKNITCSNSMRAICESSKHEQEKLQDRISHLEEALREILDFEFIYFPSDYEGDIDLLKSIAKKALEND